MTSCRRCGARATLTGEFRECAFCGFTESILPSDPQDRVRLMGDLQHNIVYDIRGLRRYKYHDPVWAREGAE